MKEIAPGVLQIESAEELEDLCKSAQETFGAFRLAIGDVLDPARCGFVRSLRVDEDATWREVAQACYEAWDGSWTPSSNQLMGMALCEAAAIAHGENYTEKPWN